MRRILIFGFALVFCFVAQSTGQISDPTDLDLDGVPGVAGPRSSPQPQAPSVLVGAGRLLIDRAHHGDANVGGFMNFLVTQGWVIAEHPFGGGPITPSVLSGFDILLIVPRTTSDPSFSYSAAEVAAIQSFLQDGGGLWLIHDNRPPVGVNTLSQVFGVTFLYDYVQDPTNNEGQPYTPTISLIDAHAITQGVGSYGYYLGDCLTVAQPARTVARADKDAYSLYCPVGSMPPVLGVYENGGRAVFAGDVTPLTPTYYPSLLRPEEQMLLQNIVNWLLGDSPTATSPTTWGILKALYAEKELTAMP